MAWKRKSTSISVNVDVDLDDITDEQLLQGLINSGIISEEEASTLLNRQKAGVRMTAGSLSDFDFDLLDRARISLRRHNRTDALHYIEQYLGREWIGALQ